MGNEYFFDPFFSEEEDIREKQKRALAIAIRGLPIREMGDYTSRTNDIAQQVSAGRELEQIPAMREALSQKYRQSLARALSGESSEVQSLGAEPSTAPIALKQLSERLERDNIARERAAIRARMAQGGGGDPIQAYQLALEEAQHPNPKISGPAKVLMESMKAIDPKNTAYIDPTGRMQTRPGSLPALGAQQDVMGETIEIEMGDGTKQRVPKSQVTAFLQQGARLPQVNAPTSPVANPSPPTYPGSPSPVASPTGPVSTPSVGPQVPPPTGPAPGGQPSPQFNFSGTPDQIAQARAIAEKDIASRVSAPLPPSGAVRPSGPVGSTPSPVDVEALKNIKQENEKALQEWSKKSNVPDLKASLEQLKKLNEQPMYTGYTSVPMALENTMGIIGIGKSEKGKNVEKFEKSSGDIIASLLPQYGSGNGISDADMRGAQMRVANAGMDPESRAEVIAITEEKVAFAEYANQRVPVLVRQGNYTLGAAKDIAYSEFKEIHAKEKAAKEARAKSISLSPANPETFKTDEHPLERSVQAIRDTVLNTGLGAANLLGYGDRKATLEEQQRQEAESKRDPVYGRAKAVTDVAKYAPAMAMGPVGAALYAGGMAAAQPGESTTSQVVEGAKAAAGGIVLGKAMSLIRGLPVTQQIQAIEDVLARMPKGAKGRAALQRELNGLQLQLDRLGGTISDLPVQLADKFIGNPLRNVMSILRGR